MLKPDKKDVMNMTEIKNKEKLIDQLQRAIDAENTTPVCYNRLATLIKNGRIRNRFRAFSNQANADKKLLKEKDEQRNFLKKEKKFVHEGENKANFIYSYCIPEVISKLWK